MKIKKILLAILLSTSITTSVILYKQRQAEAVAPVLVWAALTVIPYVVIGAYYYFTDAGNNIKARKVLSTDELTGQVDLEIDNQQYGDETAESIYTSLEGVKFYPDFVLNAFPNHKPPDAYGNTYADRWTDGVWSGSPSQAAYDRYTPTFDFVTYLINSNSTVTYTGWKTDLIYGNFNDTILAAQPIFEYEPVEGGQGGKNTGTINGFPVEFYDFLSDVPQLPTCFDGIQNQDETDIDCGGVCLTNFGFDCIPPETCFDGIMNQDETGIDYGGVCGGEPVSPAVFTDANQDNIDDIAGVNSDGSIPVGVPGDATVSTYDTSLPGTVSEIGDTDWKTLIMNYLSTSPLVQLATGATINVSGAECSLNATVFGQNVVINFCDLQWMVDLLGTFVLAIFTLRSLFIALGVD